MLCLLADLELRALNSTHRTGPSPATSELSFSGESTRPHPHERRRQVATSGSRSCYRYTCSGRGFESQAYPGISCACRPSITGPTDGTVAAWPRGHRDIPREAGGNLGVRDTGPNPDSGSPQNVISSRRRDAFCRLDFSSQNYSCLFCPIKSVEERFAVPDLLHHRNLDTNHNEMIKSRKNVLKSPYTVTLNGLSLFRPLLPGSPWNNLPIAVPSTFEYDVHGGFWREDVLYKPRTAPAVDIGRGKMSVNKLHAR